jgi:hypothetical protein
VGKAGWQQKAMQHRDLWGGGRASALRRIASGPLSSGCCEGDGGSPRAGWRPLHSSSQCEVYWQLQQRYNRSQGEFRCPKCSV